MPKKSDSQTPHETDFGFQKIPVAEKTAKVAEIFSKVAPKYDLMNDLMSLGAHRLWKRFALELASAKPGQQVLDLAGGTGDLSMKLAQRVGDTGQVILADINQAMLARGRDRLIDAGIAGNISYVQANAELLPFPDDYFDLLTIAFGLRNVARKEVALHAMWRVLKPGGKLIILEFSKPTIPSLVPWYDAYSFHVLPWLGRVVLNDAASYRYLAESIRRHPDQETLKEMMLHAGFDDCQYYNLAGGIVAVHKGYKS